MLKDDSFRSETLQRVNAAEEKRDHRDLLHCSRYRKHREVMLNQLLQVHDKNDKVLEISENITNSEHMKMRERTVLYKTE